MTQVDLFIPTFNRPDFLNRILSYYNSYKVNFNIIIADSSTKLNKKKNKKIVTSFPDLKILYLDKFPDKLISHHKFAKMLKYAKSKYCVFCADDDFVVPNGINEAVKFLEKNPDYSAAHGSYISFFRFDSGFGKKQFWWKYIYPYRSITYSDPLKRLAAHPVDCQQVLWAVRRSEIVKTCYRELMRSKADPYIFGERLPDVLTVILGKMKRLNNFYAARQGFSTSYSYWPSERDAIKDGSFNKKYTRFKKCIVKNLINISKAKKEEAAKIVDSNMDSYLSSSFQQHMVARFYYYLRYFPYILTKSLKILHARYLFLKDKRDRIGLISNPNSKYFKDFDLIRKLVLTN